MYSENLKKEVYNRGAAPDSFLTELIAWARNAPDEIFTYNDNYDIYSSVKDRLGPWVSLNRRKAAMCEVLRVLGGFESSWHWNEGRDTSNPNINNLSNEEAGIFQCSADSVGFDDSLKNCSHRYGALGSVDFIKTSKANHKFALEYCARLLRFTVNHHGPIKRKEIHPWLSKAAVLDFESLLTANAPDVALPWITKAKSYLGEKEILGSKDNTWIEECFEFTSYGKADHDEVPWCAAFLCRVLAESGYAHTHSAAAASYATYGTPCEVKFGAIAVKKRTGGNHCTFIVGPVKDGMVPCLGGNQANSVNITNYPVSDFYAVRWPVK